LAEVARYSAPLPPGSPSCAGPGRETPLDPTFT